jgi:hypothetical protein
MRQSDPNREAPHHRRGASVPPGISDDRPRGHAIVERAYEERGPAVSRGDARGGERGRFGVPTDANE